jgi:hypothetical protein
MNPDLHSKNNILVIGGGRFGCLALGRLAGKVSAVVEPQPSTKLLALTTEQSIQVLRKNGAAALEQALSSQDPPAWVVPALPKHLLVEWLLLCLPQARRLGIPAQAIPPLPSVIAGEGSQYYASLADFLCPDDCPEPAGKCTVTGQTREKPLFSLLAEITTPEMRTAVVRSYQMAPGVGGYKATDLLELRQRLVAKGGKWLLATACRCHGVLGAVDLG